MQDLADLKEGEYFSGNIMNQGDIKIINARDKFPKRRFSIPSDFPTNAIELWKNCEPYAWKAGLLTEETLPEFIDMCRSYDEQIQMALRIKKEGRVLETASGKYKNNPLCNQEKKLFNKLFRYYKQFGIGPLNRAKKGLPSPEDLG